jgi:hypothetical protein
VVRAQTGRRSLAALIAALLLLALLPAAAGAVEATPTSLTPGGGVEVGANPVLRWNAVPQAASYRVEVSANSSFSPVLWGATTFNLSATPPSDLPVGAIHWRVAGVDGRTTGPFASSTFTRTWTDAPRLIAPANDATLNYPADPPLFTWQPLQGARSYRVEIATEQQFISPVVLTTTSTSAALAVTQAVRQLGQEAQFYYWRVQGVSSTSGVNSSWSNVRRYDVRWPDVPTGLAPASGQVKDVVLSWNPVQGAAVYQVQISPNGDWANNVSIDVTVRGTRYAPHIDSVSSNVLLNNRTYFWRVRAVDAPSGAMNFGDWSTTATFDRIWTDRAREEAVSPVGGAVVATPTMSWPPILNASYYELQFGTNANFADGTYSTCFTNQTSYTPYQRRFPASGATGEPVTSQAACSPLIPTTTQTLYWRVRGLDAPLRELAAASPHGVNGLWSQAGSVGGQSFNVSHPWLPVPDAPTLATPADAAIVDRPTLEWEPIPAAHSYEVRIAAEGSSTPAVVHITSGTSFTPTAPLAPATGTFTWSVRARSWTDAETNQPGPYGPQSDRTFVLQSPTTFSAAPDALPQTPSTSAHTAPPLRWQPVEGATSYRIRYFEPGATITQAKTVTNLRHTGYTMPSASPTAPYKAGTWQWEVTALLPNNVTVTGAGSSFVVTEPAIGDVEHYTSPTNCRTTPTCPDIATTPTFRWSAVPGAGSYRLIIAADPNFTNIVRQYDTTYTELTPRESFLDNQAGQAYYWAVQPIKRDGTPGRFDSSTHARAASFRKATPSPEPLRPSPLNPDTGASVMAHQPVMSWSSYLSRSGTQDAAYYRIQTATQSDFSAATLLETRLVDQLTYTPFRTTYPEGNIFWRVQAVDGSGNPLTFSPTQIVEKRSPAVALQHPANGATVAGVPHLRWAPQHYAHRYEVELARNGDTNFSQTNRVALATTKQVAHAHSTPLAAGAYAWRVRRLDADNRPGPWSLARTFDLESAAPTPLTPADGASLSESRILLGWQAVAGAAAYRVETSTSSGFATTIESQVTVMTTWAPVRQYGEGIHHWRVRALDGAGNVLSTSAIRSFSHTTAPTVLHHRPAGTSVPVDAAFVVDFSEPVRQLSTTTFRVREVGSTRSVTATVSPSGTTSSTVATLQPGAPLQPDTEYVIELTDGVRDLAGNPLTRFEWTVRTAVAPAPSPNPTTPAPNPTEPAPAPTEVPGSNTTRRLGASTDVTTAAVDLSRGTFLDGAAQHVLIGRDDVFADSLAGAALAGKEGPILYTRGGPEAALSASTRSELQRVLGAANGCGGGPDVFILGGTNAVSAPAEAEISALGYCVKRYSGASRVETSVEIARDVVRRTGNRQVLLARADNWADAATGGAYAAASGAPIVVTQTTALHPASRDFLASTNPSEVVLLGGGAALSDDVMAAAGTFARTRRVSGAARDVTATEIAKQLWAPLSPKGVVLVNGFADNGWAYALAAAVPAAREGSVQVYVHPDQISASTQAFLDGYRYRFTVAAGPTSLIGDAVFRGVADGAAP